MKFDIKPERYNEFKKYMAKKLTDETGRKYHTEDIYVGKKDRDGNFKTIFLTERNKFKHIFCDVDFKNYDRDALDHIEFIYGNAKFISLKTTDLADLKTIGGNADFRNSSVKHLDELQFIGGDADFSQSGVTDLGKLEHVGGDLNLVGSHVKNIDSLKYVGGKISVGEIQEVWFRDKIYRKNGEFYFKNDPQYLKEKNIVEDNEKQL